MNPLLHGLAHLADPEPRLFEGRVYLYGSLDQEGGKGYCSASYRVFSCPQEDLSAWVDEGEILARKDLPPEAKGNLWAPDCVQGEDGYYYLYFFTQGLNAILVARSPSPKGPFAYLGKVRHDSGIPLGEKSYDPVCFDPAVFKDDDGKIYLHFGFSPDALARGKYYRKRFNPAGPSVVELGSDMLTIARGPRRIGIPGVSGDEGSEFAGHAFFEAPSLRKIMGRYFFIYSSQAHHELCFAYSVFPDRDFHFGGVLLSNASTVIAGKEEAMAGGNNHGSILQLHDSYYLFYHRHLGESETCRDVCLERLRLNEEGLFERAFPSSGGLAVLPANGELSAALILAGKSPRERSLLTIKKGAYLFRFARDGEYGAISALAFENPRAASIEATCLGGGVLLLSASLGGSPIAEIPLWESKARQTFASFCQPVEGEHPLYLEYRGPGRLDLYLLRFA